MSTPSRHASGRKPNDSGPLSLGLGEDEPVHADVFSTPSRLASGGRGLPRRWPAPRQPDPLAIRRTASANRLVQRRPTLHARSRLFVERLRHRAVDEHTEPRLQQRLRRLRRPPWQRSVLQQRWRQQQSSVAVAVAYVEHAGCEGASAERIGELVEHVVEDARVAASTDGNEFDEGGDDFPPSSSPFPRTPTFDGSPRFGYGCVRGSRVWGWGCRVGRRGGIRRLGVQVEVAEGECEVETGVDGRAYGVGDRVGFG